MQRAQFYKGKIDGFEQNFESMNLLELLPLDKISDLKDYNIPDKPHQRYFKAEKVIALVEVYKVENGDSAGRSGIQTRGVLYKFDRTVPHEGFNYVFPEEQFIEDLIAGKYRVKMPKLPENLTKPLDLPPPLEWEDQP